MKNSNTLNSSSLPNLGALVAALPEVYQPIHGHDDLSTASARQCEDRFGVILKLYDAFSAKLGRPLRVLDLGCA